MDTEMKTMENVPSIRLDNSNLESNRDSDIDDLIKYTSLKDVIPNSPTDGCPTSNDVCGFDSSNITIQNQLVKQAASAYLQSAAILATRNQNWVVSFWMKLRSRSALRSFWRVYVRNPIRRCIRPIFRMLGSMVNQMGFVLGRRTPIA